MKRFYLLWLYAITLTALAAAAVQSSFEERRLLAEASSRVSSLAASIEDSVNSNYHAKRFARIARIIDRLRSRNGVLGAAVCAITSSHHLSVAHSTGFPRGTGWDALCRSPLPAQSVARDEDLTWTASHLSQKFQYHAHRLEGTYHRDETLVLVLAQDLSDLRTRWMDTFGRTFGIMWLLGVGLMILITAQLRSWLQGNLKLLHHTLRSLIAGHKPVELHLAGDTSVESALRPISQDIDKLANKILTLSSPRKPNREDPVWLASLRSAMGDKGLTVIANREPYIHQRKDDEIEVVRPASGLVTALEPILRQCGGLWIAHGSGTADADVVDANGEVQVPPGNSTYTLRRVWLSKEEELGYYYGFSNEGLWPLCHLAHTRPIFRLSDWEQYRAVNQKFSDAVPETSLVESSLILVQDYHYALLPRMIKERAASSPGALNAPKIGLFWHIPWPNPEAFGICPWNQELLRGMLGADVIGFHTQYHCNNFLETCNRYLEARIDWEHFTVTMENRVTQVRAVPIGIATQPVRSLSDGERAELKAKYGIHAEIVAVGVDRLDYTKGLVERIEAVERFLEKYPEYVGRFALVQMGSPSRTHIPAYRSLAEQLEQTVNRVNLKFGDKTRADGYQPICFLPSHHEWDEIQYFYQLGDICMVTSLHDGMNLVAKEYVWCQRPDRGSLILSKFTGASRELTDAFIVNPYSIEEMADAIAGAIRMEPAERTHRMLCMREKVQNRSAFHWASDLIQALIRKDDTVVIPLRERGRSDTSTLEEAVDF